MRDRDKPDDGPETMEQARRWEVVKNRYERAGLCHICSAQAAFGHQLGFSRVHPPCPDCVPVVAEFPYPAVAPWRMTLDGPNTRAREARDASKAAS
jgi:hypothetical protein